MKTIIPIIIIAIIFSACSQKHTGQSNNKINKWKDKQTSIKSFEEFHNAKTYLPVYSHIYHIHEHRAFDLTITVSIRNISLTDTVFILKADYYNTVGENIRQYIKTPIFLLPLETLEIVIEQKDSEGGSGANFVFDWAKRHEKNPPLFEAVMISTEGQQGLSFTTKGVQLVE
jgi:hypothetical protein